MMAFFLVRFLCRKIFIGGLAKDTTLGEKVYRFFSGSVLKWLNYVLRRCFGWYWWFYWYVFAFYRGFLGSDTFVKYFEKYGEITDSVIMKDRHTGRPRGFGFITYADPSVVDQVIKEDHVINGKQVIMGFFLF